jgi:hypothetical protein
LQPYETERKKSTKCYTELFKRLLNTWCLCALQRKPEREATKPSGHQTSDMKRIIWGIWEDFRTSSPRNTIQDTNVWQTDSKTLCRKDTPRRDVQFAARQMGKEKKNFILV